MRRNDGAFFDYLLPLVASDIKMRTVYFLICAIAIGSLAVWPKQGVADEFNETVSPFIAKYCVECHSEKVHKGDLDLTSYASSQDVTAHFRRWQNVVEFLRNGEMPPEDSLQPSIEERNAVIAQVEDVLLTEAVKHAGDPGIVLPRRLSNTEYDTAIRDLTGIDIGVTKDFPADPAGGEGFDNTGEALGTSPNLVKKYLAAAQRVSEHMVLKPGGIAFSPFPVTSYNERKKLTELEIIQFYEQHNVQVEKYLEAAWRYRYRGRDDEQASIEQYATRVGLSGRYLSLVWRTLSEASSRAGFMSQVGDVWNAIPSPTNSTDIPSEFQQLRELIGFGRRMLAAPEGQLINASAGNWPIGHLDLRAKVARGRDQFDRSALKSEAFLNGIRIEESKKGADLVPYSVFLRVDTAFSDTESPDEDCYVIIKSPLFSKANHMPNNEADAKQHETRTLRSVLERFHPELVGSLGFGTHPKGVDIHPDCFVVRAPAVIEIPITADMQRELIGKHLLLSCQLDRDHSLNGSALVQASIREVRKSRYDGNAKLLVFEEGRVADALTESGQVFCNAFPSRFFYVDDVRGLAAGFHLVEGFFRDDQPLVQKVLTANEREELDRLWQELDFVTESAENLLRGFVWFERSEREVLHDKRFDFLRSEDPQLIENSLLDKFERLYLEKLGVKLVDDSLEPTKPDAKYTMVHRFFQEIRDGLLLQQELTKIAEHRALEDVKSLASRAFRRPVLDSEYSALLILYKKLREDGQPVEAAVRGLLIAVLMSPSFSYHQTSLDGMDGVQPLDNYDVASRLSFFLWSSIPDAVLLESAASGKLQDDSELRAQVRRMLKDPKIESFAREFLGQWLRYRDYLEKDPILADAFPGYSDELRSAIFDEPTHLATYLIQKDLPITELLSSDLTFVNAALAKHYGGELETRYRQSAESSKGTNWHPVTGLHTAGRGGLLGMAVTLTKNSAGERTSPVKRGFWAVHHLLGQHFPPPPADVPELPRSEKVASATIRELLASHVSQPQCAMCHSHFDGLGVAMEGFDAIGRARSKDSGGRPIDDVAILREGDKISGIPGLAQYIVEKRKDDFMRTFCRKFLGYALGRSVELSDQPLLMKMQTSLLENQLRFSVLFEEVVLSPQFRNHRGYASLPVEPIR